MHGWVQERTIEEETLQGLLYVELGVKDDEPEADGECVVAGASLEEVADGGQGGVVGLLGLDGREMRSVSRSAGGWLALWRSWGLRGGERRGHRRGQRRGVQRMCKTTPGAGGC